MSAHPDLRAPTGRPRGPEQYGEKTHDPERDGLRLQLQRFEALADPNDAAAQAVLAEMREHTRELEYLRGVWDKRGLPGVSRDWNAPVKSGAPPPKESLLEYQAWKDSERRRKLLLEGLPLPPELALSAPPGPPRLEAAPATAASAAAAPPPARPRRCALRTKGVTRAQFLDALDAACAIDWGDELATAAAAGAATQNEVL